LEALDLDVSLLNLLDRLHDFAVLDFQLCLPLGALVLQRLIESSYLSSELRILPLEGLAVEQQLCVLALQRGGVGVRRLQLGLKG